MSPTCKNCFTNMGTGIALVPEYTVDKDRPNILQLPVGKLRSVYKCEKCGYTITKRSRV